MAAASSTTTATTQTGSPTTMAVPCTPPLFPSPAAAIAAAAQGLTMSVLSVSKGTQTRSPIISTAIKSIRRQWQRRRQVRKEKHEGL
jgi:hypothetical protein